jgi:hypothetical protein
MYGCTFVKAQTLWKLAGSNPARVYGGRLLKERKKILASPIYVEPKQENE